MINHLCEDCYREGDMIGLARILLEEMVEGTKDEHLGCNTESMIAMNCINGIQVVDPGPRNMEEDSANQPTLLEWLSKG